MLLSEDGSQGRKDWIDLRLKELDQIFAISVGGFSIMDNHLHFLLRIDVEQAAEWSAPEVARRWMTLYPPRGADRKPAKVTEEFLKLRADNPTWVEETRKRLSSLGWFMKCLKESLARMANGSISSSQSRSAVGDSPAAGRPACCERRLGRDSWLIRNSKKQGWVRCCEQFGFEGHRRTEFGVSGFGPLLLPHGIR